MKVKTFAGLLLVSLFLLSPGTGFSMSVSFYLGQATITRDGKTADIKSGDIIKEGDIIKTAKGGIVEILYDDNSKITIQEKTIVQIGSRDVKGSSDITVIAGEIKGKFGKLKKGVHRINTPTTVCSVRGTEFEISVSRGGDSLVNLNEGTLDVDNSDGGILLKEGQRVESELGKDSEVNDGSVNTDEWQTRKDEEALSDVEETADRYNDHFVRFEKSNDRLSEDMEGMDERTSNAKTKEDLEKSGKEIASTEEDLEHDMLMNEASRLNAEYLMQESEGKEGYDDLKDAVKKGNAVADQQKKNYEAIQKIKAKYKESYDRIMKKYKDKKTDIYKNLDEYKNKNRINKEE